jgi:hypothetical protein
MAKTDGLKPPFKKGEVHNPNGRPKGVVSVAAEMRKLIMQRVKITPEDGKKCFTTTRARAIATKILDEAQRGDDKFCRMVLDRIDGKVDILSTSEEDKISVVRITVEEITKDSK